MSRRRTFDQAVEEVEEVDDEDMRDLTRQFEKTINRQQSPPKFSFQSQKKFEVTTYIQKRINNKILIPQSTIAELEKNRQQLERILGRLLITKSKSYRRAQHVKEESRYVVQFVDENRSYENFPLTHKDYVDGYQTDFILQSRNSGKIRQIFANIYNVEEIVIHNKKFFDGEDLEYFGIKNPIDLDIDDEDYQNDNYSLLITDKKNDRTKPSGILLVTNKLIQNFTITDKDIKVEEIKFNSVVGVNIFYRTNKDELIIIFNDLSHIYLVKQKTRNLRNYFTVKEINILNRSEKYLKLEYDESFEKDIIFDISELKFYEILKFKNYIRIVDENDIEVALTKRAKLFEFIGEEMNFF